MNDASQNPGASSHAMPDPASASIVYVGIKEARVPIPVVLVCLVAVIAVLYAMRHLLGA